MLSPASRFRFSMKFQVPLPGCLSSPSVYFPGLESADADICRASGSRGHQASNAAGECIVRHSCNQRQCCTICPSLVPCDCVLWEAGVLPANLLIETSRPLPHHCLRRKSPFGLPACRAQGPRSRGFRLGPSSRCHHLLCCFVLILRACPA